jgi:hypothetical protein
MARGPPKVVENVWVQQPLLKSQNPGKPMDLHFGGHLLETRNPVFKQNCHLDRGSVVERSAVFS